MRTTHCKSCPAEIFWVKTVNGKAMPLDAEPADTGNVVVVNGQAIVFAGPDRIPDEYREVPRYLSHHISCPQGRAWRKR
jgi:hypothetical protein